MKRKLISYCVGGLCNRIQPLASAMAYAKQYDRELLVVWDGFRYCEASLSDLFQNDFTVIDQQEFQSYGYPYSSSNERNTLIEMLRRLGPMGQYNQKKMEEDNVVMLLSNQFLPHMLPEAHSMLRSFEPTDELNQKIRQFTQDLKLTKQTPSIHARGTDMGISPTWYADKIRHIKGHAFLATDCKDMKRILTAQFPNLVTTPEQSFFDKYNTARPWERGNLVIHKEAVKSGVIDLYLLAATDLKVACPTSSFAKVARIIGEKYEH